MMLGGSDENTTDDGIKSNRNVSTRRSMEMQSGVVILRQMVIQDTTFAGVIREYQGILHWE